MFRLVISDSDVPKVRLGKVDRDQILVRALMAKTFAFRRQSIVTQPVLISVLVQQWPALFTHSEVISDDYCLFGISSPHIHCVSKKSSHLSTLCNFVKS